MERLEHSEAHAVLSIERFRRVALGHWSPSALGSHLTVTAEASLVVGAGRSLEHTEDLLAKEAEMDIR